MAELLKNYYNESFFDRFSTVLKKVFPPFQKVLFRKQLFSSEWNNMELKQRMRHVSVTLHKQLPNDFEQTASILIKTAQELSENNKTALGKTALGFEYMCIPDYIEVYGLDYFKLSMKAFEKITQMITCEFAIRPFLIKYPKKGMKQMQQWSKHAHPQVRRLSSEGARPRLPWAMALPELKKDPTPLLPILENLKNDDSETVRRSVSNNLNDISKDHPSLVIDLAKKWMGKSEKTDRVMKHACRTLLKQGEPVLMSLFGYGSLKEIKVHNFKIITPEVRIGEYLEFSFSIQNKNKADTLLRLEYAIYYQKANGSLSKKVFKISEKAYAGFSTTEITRRQPFKIITTRVLHKGLHQVSLIINGVELERHDFLFLG